MISQNSFMSCFQHTISLSVFLHRVQVPASLKDPPQHCYPQWRRGGWVRRFFKKEIRINRDASLLTLKRNSLLYRTVKLNIPSYFKKGVFASLCNQKAHQSILFQTKDWCALKTTSSFHLRRQTLLITF